MWLIHVVQDIDRDKAVTVCPAENLSVIQHTDTLPCIALFDLMPDGAPATRPNTASVFFLWHLDAVMFWEDEIEGRHGTAETRSHQSFTPVFVVHRGAAVALDAPVYSPLGV